MSDEQPTAIEAYASTSGQLMTEVGWLDAHFETCRPEYGAMLRSVGIQTGWHVLDAGCGGGSFLPLISELVGPSGRIAALDLASDNIAAVEQRVVEWDLPTPVDARVGSVLALPYADDTFDAVWCAATSQYLTGAELATSLAEFRRVVRPGGLVAIKDVDGTAIGFVPAPPLIIAHLFEAMAERGNDQFAGCMRVQSLAQCPEPWWSLTFSKRAQSDGRTTANAVVRDRLVVASVLKSAYSTRCISLHRA